MGSSFWLPLDLKDFPIRQKEVKMGLKKFKLKKLNFLLICHSFSFLFSSPNFHRWDFLLAVFTSSGVYSLKGKQQTPQRRGLSGAAARPEWCSDASGAVSSSRRRRGPQSGSGARWGTWCGGSEGVWPLHAFDGERAAGAGRQGSGLCTEVTNRRVKPHIQSCLVSVCSDSTGVPKSSCSCYAFLFPKSLPSFSSAIFQTHCFVLFLLPKLLL